VKACSKIAHIYNAGVRGGDADENAGAAGDVI